MSEPWLKTFKLRDFGTAGKIQNITDLRSNLVRDDALALPPAPTAAGRSAEYRYGHGVELLLHNLFAATIGRQNAIFVVKHLFGQLGWSLNERLGELPEIERNEIIERAKEINPMRHTLGLVSLNDEALGPNWISRDLANPSIVAIVTTPEGVFPTFKFNKDTPASELISHIEEMVGEAVNSVSVFNLTRTLVQFDESLNRMSKWAGGNFGISDTAE